MPELKRAFVGGRMEKDQDERIISNGLYREALNITVSTSEDSDVGAAQNILGNIKVSEAIQGPQFSFNKGCGAINLNHGRYSINSKFDKTLCNKHIASVIDPQTDMLYRFVATEAKEAGVWMDRIIEYDTNATLEHIWQNKEAPVLVDVYKIETRIKISQVIRDGCNKSEIYICKNPWQVKPGMLLKGPGELEGENIYIETIQWLDLGDGPQAKITLSENLFDFDAKGFDGYDITFHSDRVLNFSPDRKITAINVIDGMIFWTDNYSEPKKVNIKRGKEGSQYIPGDLETKNSNLHNHTNNPLSPEIISDKYFHFDIPTRLRVGDGWADPDCFKNTLKCPILGCTDPTAFNYNPNATVDDGSCILPTLGCTDPNAYNYDPLANIDDGSCCLKAGCMNPIYCNYDALACYDDGSCAGCNDPLATNDGDHNCCEYLWWCLPEGYPTDSCSALTKVTGVTQSNILGDWLEFYSGNQSLEFGEQWNYLWDYGTAFYSGMSPVGCPLPIDPDDFSAGTKRKYHLSNATLNNILPCTAGNCMNGASPAPPVTGPNSYGDNYVITTGPGGDTWFDIITIIRANGFDGTDPWGVNGTGELDQITTQVMEEVLYTDDFATVESKINNYGNGWSFQLNAEAIVNITFGGEIYPCFCSGTPTIGCECVVDPVNGIHNTEAACKNDQSACCYEEPEAPASPLPPPTAPAPDPSGGSSAPSAPSGNGSGSSGEPIQDGLYSSPLKWISGPPPTQNPIRGGGVVSGENAPTIEDIEGEENIICNPVYVQEKHITVIRKGPTTPPNLEMYSWEEDADINPNYSDPTVLLNATFTGDAMPQASNDASGGNQGTATNGDDISIFYDQYKNLKTPGSTFVLPVNPSSVGFNLDWKVGYKISIQHAYTDSFGISKIAICKASILLIDDWDPATSAIGPYIDSHTNTEMVFCKIMGITQGFPIEGTTSSESYTVSTIQKPSIFEKKFPRFGYRYKYDDGEYSIFSPWSEVAFIPGKFDYLPKKGYNLGMVNNLRTLKILNWRPKNVPKDVVKIDVLYKESNSPNVYTVDSFEKDDPKNLTYTSPSGNSYQINNWLHPGTGNNFGNYTVDSELIHKVVPSNQMLRPWDNVPRKALGQEVTANRLIFANYVESFDIKDRDKNLIVPEFSITIETTDQSSSLFSIADPLYEQVGPKNPLKSLKSMRTYQLGIVYRDRYGRETPVLTSESASIKVPKENAKLQSKLSAKILSPPPYWAESYTFYLKETSNEYYNVSMDRWYDAEDDGIWLSFPSAERDKISDRTTLILKKQHNSDTFVDSDIKYKVLAVENDAPNFIKTESKYWGSLPMMLPPPGWGVGGKVGSWQSGMFHPTGLPLPNRLFLDIYAEYFDQSVLGGLIGLDVSEGSQIRVVQSAGGASSYVSWSSNSINKSRWYDIAKVGYIGTPQETYTDTVNIGGISVDREVEVPGQAEQLVRITLEEAMGNDMSFCEPTSTLALSRGLSIEVRTRQKVDKAQFEGRFFVKVLREVDLETHIIQPTQKVAETWQVLMAKDISYICMAHPGVQDWRTDESSTIGASSANQGKYYNVGHTHNLNYIQPAQNFTNISKANYEKLEVSTFSKSAGDASFNEVTGVGTFGPQGPPQNPPTTSLWPFGPGEDSNIAYGLDQWYITRDQNYLDNTVANAWDVHYYQAPILTASAWPGGSIFKNESTQENNWPAYIGDWSPFTCRNCTLLSTNYVSGHYGGGIDLSNVVYPDFNLLPGANSYNVPAIWGDQTDIINAASWSVAGVSGGGGIDKKSQWTATTIEALRQDWYYLWHGRDKVDKTWLLGRHSPQRWFFDKVGAASGGSGNGIWDDIVSGGKTVSKMHISYYGIGSVNSNQRSFDLMMEQDIEYSFGEALYTVGTQFRFAQDPDQIVYTVTNIGGIEQCFNYETSHGSWGIGDGTNSGTCSGGGNLGGSLCPPWGSENLGANTIAGKGAFFSDLFSTSREKNGSAPYNYRTRLTITLDKQIGSEGQYNFHPLTNHVGIRNDGTEYCNIKHGAQRYWAGTLGVSPSDWIGGYHPDEEIGGTPSPYSYFNLSSYWNCVDAGIAEDNQHPSRGVGDTNGQHFGLHERGINQTTIEIVTPYRGDEVEPQQSINPAIWETEPMEDVGLDIYYAISPSYPISIKRYRMDYAPTGYSGAPDELDYHSFNPANTPSLANWYDYHFRGEEFIPVGAIIELYDDVTGLAGSANVIGVQGDIIWMDNMINVDSLGNPIPLVVGQAIKFNWKGEGSFYGGKKDNENVGYYQDLFVKEVVDNYTIKISYGTWDPALLQVTYHPMVHNVARLLGYFNCYSFSNGVESNRIRDDYNAITIDKGVKASMPLAEEYKEERKPSSLIFSGIYNSTSGINRTNQFIQAEPITKDLNPVNGSIQKLFARDTDLITFCENKVFKILAKKDALFNADGNTNITSNAMVLGQAIPFVGEYGISKNPESFASESYRIYFSDKARGTILRLSRDGLTPISDAGMKDWFRDNLRFASSIVGSFDDREDHYNITIETVDQDSNEKAYTLSYTEKKRGWESFKSFITQDGISHKNVYYTFPSNKYTFSSILDNWGVRYSGSGFSNPVPGDDNWPRPLYNNSAEVHQHSLDIKITKLYNELGTLSGPGSGWIKLNSGYSGFIQIGMNVEGNGIPLGTTVLAINDCECFDPVTGAPCGACYNQQTNTFSQQWKWIRLSNQNFFLDDNAELTFSTRRDSFYGVSHYSMVKLIHMGNPGDVKRFKTISYEGTQAKTVKQLNNKYQLHQGVGLASGVNVGQIYYDNYEKSGWWAKNIKTDLQEGTIAEFLDKENKWYNYIRGFEDAGIGDDLDTKEFSLQGLGYYQTTI